MPSWSFLDRPSTIRNEADFQRWFADIASHLLNGCRLIAGGVLHRLAEIEFYYRSADHPDPFPHTDPIQFAQGRWYFHKTRGGYRGGSYKGIDLTFGHEGATGGILIRAIELPDERLIEGPSLTVDYLIGMTRCSSVRECDAAIAGRLAWDPKCPIRLELMKRCEERPVFSSSRVGLAGLVERPLGSHFADKRYRFLTEPRRIRKSKSLLVRALVEDGLSAETIRQITGSPMHIIREAMARG